MTNQEINIIREIVRVFGWRKNRGRHERKALALCRELLGSQDYMVTINEARFEARQKYQERKGTQNATV